MILHGHEIIASLAIPLKILCSKLNNANSSFRQQNPKEFLKRILTHKRSFSLVVTPLCHRQKVILPLIEFLL